VHNARRERPGAVPIVELATGHWVSRQYGRVLSPEFRVVGWKGPKIISPPALALAHAEIDDEIPF
jgi:hypothetical protein